jgi:hypothetical protein
MIPDNPTNSADAMKLLDEIMQLPHMKKVMFARARQDKDFTIGGAYYNEALANTFVRPMADAMMKTKKDLKIAYSDYEGISSPNTLHAKVTQGAKYLADLGGEEYSLWRSLVKIQKKPDHILLKFIKPPSEHRDADKPIFHLIEDESKQEKNKYQDLYDWIENAEAGKLYHKTGLNLEPDDIQSLNLLFNGMPQFTARVKHNEIKVIRESIEDAKAEPEIRESGGEQSNYSSDI